MQFTGSNKTKSGTPRVTPKTWMLWCMFLTFLPPTEPAWLTQLHITWPWTNQNRAPAKAALFQFSVENVSLCVHECVSDVICRSDMSSLIRQFDDDDDDDP